MSAPATEQPRQRWWRFTRERRLFCPHGHHVPHTFRVTEGGFIRCSKWSDATRRDCGAWLYLLAFRGGGILTAEVSLDEMREMEHLSTPTEIIDYLRLWA